MELENVLDFGFCISSMPATPLIFDRNSMIPIMYRPNIFPDIFDNKLIYREQRDEKPGMSQFLTMKL